MSSDRRTQRIDTTIGELVAILTDTAVAVCPHERAAYLLVALTLDKMLENSTAMRGATRNTPS